MPPRALQAGALAYNPMLWTWKCDYTLHLLSSGSSYTLHLFHTWVLASQLLVAAVAGFVHAGFACLCPFIAEEVGAEVCVIATHLQLSRDAFDDDDDDQTILGTPCYHDGTKRSRDMVPQRQGWPYAFSPHRWILYVDGSRHVRFSGGSYWNHARFACWASAQFLVGAFGGYIHGLCPMVLPTLCEDIAIELGGLIIKRRKLRNLVAREKLEKKDSGVESLSGAAEVVTLVNPDNLSDYFSDEFEQRFDEAHAAAERDGDIGEPSNKALSMLAQGRVKVQLGPGMEKSFL